MSSTMLVEQFENLVARAGDVEQLNRAILHLAMQGKLVTQDPKDEAADKVLERIRSEMTVVAGVEALPSVEVDERPFDLPSTWIWARLGDVSAYGGAQKSGALAITDATWVLDLEDIEKTSSRVLQKVRYQDRPFQSEKNSFVKGDVVYGKLRPYLDKVIVADEDGVCSSELVPIRPYSGISSEFLRLALKRPDFLEYVNQRTYGVKMPRLGTKDARLALIPLPPPR